MTAAAHQYRLLLHSDIKFRLLKCNPKISLGGQYDWETVRKLTNLLANPAVQYVVVGI